jgi:anti-anti-sigma regulatory factor
VSGEIDITNSLAFRQRLLELEGATQVVLVLDDASRVEMTGLSAIIELARRCGRADRRLDIVCSEAGYAAPLPTPASTR